MHKRVTASAIRLALLLLCMGQGVCAEPRQGAGSPPTNLLSNSQWEIWSTVRYGARERPDGPDEMGPTPIVGNTVGCNRTILRLARSADQLKIGDLVTVQGPAADPRLKLAPMRVLALTPGTVTVTLPLGLAPSVSGTGMLQPVNIGMSGSLGTGDAADGWKKSLDLMVWREDNRINIWPRAQYALGVKKTATHEQEVRAEFDARRFRGRTISFGALVSQHAGRSWGWRLFVQSDGAAGTRSLGEATMANDYQWRELSYRVPEDASRLSVGLLFEGAPDTIFFVSDPVLAFGSAIGFDNYVKPTEWLIPVVHISPITWIDAAVNFPEIPDAAGLFSVMFDAYAETGGAITPGVAQMTGSIEGIDSNPLVLGASGSRVIAWRDSERDPVRLGPIMGQVGVAVKSFAAVSIPLDPKARAGYFTGVAGDSWSNVSMDLDLFLLR